MTQNKPQDSQNEILKFKQSKVKIRNRSEKNFLLT